METIMISSESKGNIKLLKELAKKLGDSVKTISVEQMEDIALGQLMQKTETGRLVEKDSILKRLREI